MAWPAARSVEVTLRAGAGARGALQDLEVGQVVRGRVKRVERYGVFVEARRPAALPPTLKLKPGRARARQARGALRRLRRGAPPSLQKPLEL